MSFKVIPFNKNREIVYDLLKRAKKYHCTVGSCNEYDITEVYKKLQDLTPEGQNVSITSFIVKATAHLLELHPRLNHHLFHGLFSKKEVAFKDINCSLVMERKDSKGRPMLLPLIVKNPHKMNLKEISDFIKINKTTPLDELPQFQSFMKARKMPRWVLSLFSYKLRSDPDFYLKHFGTYGLSSLVHYDSPGTSMHSLCNTGSGFIPSLITDRVVVKDNKIQIRKMLCMYFMVDHYIMDGIEMLKTNLALRDIIENPTFLE